MTVALILCVGGWQITRARDADLLDAERDARNSFTRATPRSRKLNA